MTMQVYPVLLAWNIWLLGTASAKWVEGHIDTKQNWAFLARFCFLSRDGQFEYLIEYDRDLGTPNLLLYYDDVNQWPAVYHSYKSCKDKESVLNKVGKNQIIRLSHWYPDTEASGCVIKRENKELPAPKSTATSTTQQPKTKSNTTTTVSHPEPFYYDQFLKTTTSEPKAITAGANSTAWYEISSVDEANFTTTDQPEDGLWESIGSEDHNASVLERLKDVEVMFDSSRSRSGIFQHKIKRSTVEVQDGLKRRRLNSDTNTNALVSNSAGNNVERFVVTCHKTRWFKSGRPRWWFIAISNCDSTKGLDVRYKFLMTNGNASDFWHLHFSADEFYVLPILIAYTLAYVIVMLAVVMCSVELKSRHLLHSTYKLFLMSTVLQHFGVVMQSLAYIKYASDGVDHSCAKVTGQFMCGLSEMSYLLLLVLMAKGYTITRGRLKVGFTVKLTVFMCCYCVTYIILFVYQAKAFDPGEVLYLYESPPGYGLIVLRIVAWCMFAYSTFFTVRKYPEKNMFYCPFFICGTLWFYAGPLFILAANSYVDKWVRESVVIAVLLFITFCGHIMFLLLTLPLFANKNFPYHVRTTQIGVMEVTGNGAIDGFGHNAYHPANGASQTVIIPLTRRTEELIGNIYNQYMATAPPLSLEDDTYKLNGVPKSLTSISPTSRLVQQDSTDTNTSEDIQPTIMKENTYIGPKNDSKNDAPNVDSTGAATNTNAPKIDDARVFTIEDKMAEISEKSSPKSGVGGIERKELPTVLRSKRNILEPIRSDAIPPPSWSLAKGSTDLSKLENGVKYKENNGNTEPTKPYLINGRNVPAVKNGLQASSGEISTILEGRVQNYHNSVNKTTIDLFSAKK